MISINEAYNKGLDDAENNACEKLKKVLNGEYTDPFINPKMEEIKWGIITKNLKISELEVIPQVEPQLSVDYSVFDSLESIILNKDYSFNSENEKHRKIIDTFESLMVQFRTLASKKNNVGKAFDSILKEKQNALTTA